MQGSGPRACGRWPASTPRFSRPVTVCRSSVPPGSARPCPTPPSSSSRSEAQTLALMNVGAPLDRVIHEVEVPAHLGDQPYLRPIYDHPQFLVRNIWRLYGGWYDGEPDHLLPAPRAEQAREWITWPAVSTRSWPGPPNYESQGTCVWPATSSRWPWSPRPHPARPMSSGPRSMRHARRSSPRRWGAISSTTLRSRAGTAGAIWLGSGESGKRCLRLQRRCRLRASGSDGLGSRERASAPPRGLTLAPGAPS